MRTQKEYDEIIADYNATNYEDLEDLTEEDLIKVQLMRMEIRLARAERELKQLKTA